MGQYMLVVLFRLKLDYGFKSLQFNTQWRIFQINFFRAVKLFQRKIHQSLPNVTGPSFLYQGFLTKGDVKIKKGPVADLDFFVVDRQFLYHIVSIGKAAFEQWAII